MGRWSRRWCVRWWCAGVRRVRGRHGGRWRRGSSCRRPLLLLLLPSSGPGRRCGFGAARSVRWRWRWWDRRDGCGAGCAGASHPLTSGASRTACRRTACRRSACCRPARCRSARSACVCGCWSLGHQGPSLRVSTAVRRGSRWLPRPGVARCRPRSSPPVPRTLRQHRCSPSGPGPRARCANAGRWAPAPGHRWWRWPVRPLASGRCSGCGPVPGERCCRVWACLYPYQRWYEGGRRPPRVVRARAERVPGPSGPACSARCSGCSSRSVVWWPAAVWSARTVWPSDPVAYADGHRGAVRRAGPGRSTGAR